DEPGRRLIEIVFRPRAVRTRQSAVRLDAQTRYCRAHLVAARRPFTEPEWHGWRLALCVGDAHHATADPQDAPRRVAELEHVARQRFDGEILVERAEEVTFGLEHHAVIEHFRNRAARSD